MTNRFSKCILPALFCLLVVLNNSVFASNKTPAAILVLGDSLSGAWGINADEGWVALLQQKITKQGFDYQVINASVSGDTSRTGLSRIDSALQEHKPAIVIVALGGNDGLRGLAFSEIENSLASIIERCQKDGAHVLLSGVRLPPNYGTVYIEQFAALYQGLSVRYGVPLVPRMLDQVAENRALMQQDGIHPKAEAQPQIMENVWVELEQMLVKNRDEELGTRDE
jgi:acyl-CoA thioesterase-1